MCRILEVAASGFYAWIHQPLSERAIEDERLLGLIRESYAASGRIYGSPRVFLDLREAGEQIGRKRVARIMRTSRIKAIRGYRAPRHGLGMPSTIAPNRLQRRFTVDQPDYAWVTDITYIRTWEGWLYLCSSHGPPQSNDHRLVDAAHACSRHRSGRTLDGCVEARA